MVWAEELWVLVRDKELGHGVAVDTITNIWLTATDWLDAYLWGVLVALLLLISAIYLISVGRRTRT